MKAASHLLAGATVFALGIASAQAGYMGQPPVYQQPPPSHSLGYSATDGPYFSAHAGALWLRDVSTMGVDVSFDTGWGAFGALGYRFTNNLALEAEFGYARANIDDISFGATSFPVSGDVSQIPLLANAVLHVPVADSFGFYFGGGAGVVRTNVSAESLAKLPIDLDETGWNFAMQAKAGVSFNVNDALSLNLGYRLLYGNDALANEQNSFGNFFEGGFTFRF